MRPYVREIMWMLVPVHAEIVASDSPACKQQLTNVCRVRYGVADARAENWGNSVATWRTAGLNSRRRQFRAWWSDHAEKPQYDYDQHNRSQRNRKIHRSLFGPCLSDLGLV